MSCVTTRICGSPPGDPRHAYGGPASSPAAGHLAGRRAVLHVVGPQRRRDPADDERAVDLERSPRRPDAAAAAPTAARRSCATARAARCRARRNRRCARPRPARRPHRRRSASARRCGRRPRPAHRRSCRSIRRRADRRARAGRWPARRGAVPRRPRPSRPAARRCGRRRAARRRDRRRATAARARASRGRAARPAVRRCARKASTSPVSVASNQPAVVPHWRHRRASPGSGNLPRGGAVAHHGAPSARPARTTKTQSVAGGRLEVGIAPARSTADVHVSRSYATSRSPSIAKIRVRSGVDRRRGQLIVQRERPDRADGEQRQRRRRRRGRPGLSRRSSLASIAVEIAMRASALQHLVVRRCAHTVIIASSLPVPSVSHQTIIVLDFGSQYTQLIARRLRELSVYSEIWPPDTPADKIRARAPVGIILSGGPKSVSDAGRAAVRSGAVRAGQPGARHLLRHAADGATRSADASRRRRSASSATPR